MERVPEIDGLRALAALSVFVHHVFAFPAIVRITGAGWIGVDLFFVISGYLITSILLGMRDDPHYFKVFYMRRTLRIFPPYYAFFLLCFALYAVFPQFQGDHRSATKLWLAFALYGTSLVVVRPWYFGAVSELLGPIRAIEVTWSLSIEELFYLLWAPAVRFIKKQHLGVLILGVILVAPALRWWLHSPGQRTEYYFFPARMDTLAFGALLALFKGRVRLARLRGWMVGVSLAVSAALLFLIRNPEYNAFFAVFGYTAIALSMMLVLAFVLENATTSDPVCRILRSPLLVRLGTISYMFYLLHLFVIFGFRLVFADVLLSHWAWNRVLQITSSLAVTIVLASFSWKYFESPILRLKSRFETRSTHLGGEAVAGPDGAMQIPKTEASEGK